MKVIDNPDRQVIRGVLDPEKAYLAGKLVTDDVEQLQRFRRVFPVDPQITFEVANEVKDDLSRKHDAGTLENRDVADVAFLKLLPRLFDPSQARGWNATLNFDISDAGPYQMRVSDDGVKFEAGVAEDPSAMVKMDLETLTGILNYGALSQASLIQRVEIDDSELLDCELDDEQLEAVAGGKGCGSKGRSACGSDACGAEGAGGAVCGFDACGAASCGGAVCGGASCGTAHCLADACAGDACGADLGVGACAGNLCGVALGAGVCGGNVCAVDVVLGGDVGPCGVNVVPGVPGI